MSDMGVCFEGDLTEPAEFDGGVAESPAHEGELTEPAEFDGRLLEC